jgi:translation initiation factor IF-1
MQWKPLSGNTLAVGCRYGVCVWSIVSKKVQRPNIAIKEGDNDANANSYQEQSAWMTYLKYVGQCRVAAIRAILTCQQVSWSRTCQLSRMVTVRKVSHSSVGL